MTNLAKMRIKIKKMDESVEALKQEFNTLAEDLTKSYSNQPNQPLVNKKEN